MIRLTGHDIRLRHDTALTFGKFESLHLGHRALVAGVIRLAKAAGWRSAVVTFTPHPRAVLTDPSYRPLRTDNERAAILERLGTDYLMTLPFDAALARWSPEIFGNLLFVGLRGRAVVLGEGARFGYLGAGTAELLRSLAEPHGASVHTLPPLTGDDGEPVSTSRIRALMAARDLPKANALLGEPFFLRAAVVRGKQLGRKLGFPTLNLRLDNGRALPPDGVYATVTTLRGVAYRSLTNIGTRPTVEDGGARSAESFLLDYDGDAYGQIVDTAFHAFLRPERKFADADALAEQLRRDVEQIWRKYENAAETK